MGRSGERELKSMTCSWRTCRKYQFAFIQQIYTDLKDIHLHVLEPTENLIRNQFYKGGDISFSLNQLFGMEKTSCRSGVGLLYQLRFIG